jgi:hypothetical protein
MNNTQKLIKLGNTQQGVPGNEQFFSRRSVREREPTDREMDVT